MDFHWGLSRPLPQVWKSRRLSPDKTAYIKATRLEKQWDYLATLSAHYRDGAILMRPIKGVFRQVNVSLISFFSQNSHFENIIFHEIHISKISFFMKFTFLKSHFSQNSHFENLILHKIHIFKISFFTKFTISKSYF